MDASELLEKVKAIPGLVDVHWEGDRLVAYKAAQVHQVKLAGQVLASTPSVAVEKRPVAPVVAATPATTPCKRKKASAAAETALFGGVHLLGAPVSAWTKEQDRRLHEILAGNPMVITCTRDGTKTMARIRREVELMVAGTWASSHQWRNPARDAARASAVKFATIGEALDDIGDTLDAIAVEMTRAGYPWPPVKDGCRERRSLLDFLVSRNREGECWSPYLDARDHDFGDWEQVRTNFPEPQRKLLDDVFRSSWLYRKAGDRSMLAWWKGARKFFQWYASNRELLQGQPGRGSRVAWSTLTSAIMTIKDWTEETGLMPTTFIGPWSTQWGDFRRWLESSRDTTLPRI